MDQEQLSFRALADPTRRNILQLLVSKPMTISEVSENFDITRAAIKKHLTILREGDLIDIQPEGRSRINTLNPEALKRVSSWFEFFNTFWDDRLNALKSEIEKDVQ